MLLAHASGLVHFRKRVTGEILSEINDLIVVESSKDTGNEDDEDPPDDNGADTGEDESDHTEDGGEQTENDGTLLMDATCVPASIRYPTDLALLNDAREMTESIIDTCHAPDVGVKEKPRTYRRTARKQYLAVAKKKPRVKAIRRALGQHLQYIRRNLETIGRRYSHDLMRLSRYQNRSLLVDSEIYRQQQTT